MKLLELYSLATGLRIGQQYLVETFYPLPFDRYVTIQGGSGMQSKNYPYYGEVLGLLLPALKVAGIHVVQLGGKDDPAGLIGREGVDDALVEVGRVVGVAGHPVGDPEHPLVVLSEEVFEPAGSIRRAVRGGVSRCLHCLRLRRSESILVHHGVRSR
mgnify:CR=1 FL=1